MNILLSFAQFEREVIGERVRDKIAASKARGVWMGGSVPLGYEVRDRKLVVNEAEAATAVRVFEAFAAVRSATKLLPVLRPRAFSPRPGGSSTRVQSTSCSTTEPWSARSRTRARFIPASTRPLWSAPCGMPSMRCWWTARGCAPTRTRARRRRCCAD